MPEKLVLVYIDSLRTDMLERAIAGGRAPNLGRLVERGVLIGDCVSSFPSVTPVASAEMVTGGGSDRHWISGMNWYHRAEKRYVEYGSSLDASRAFGVFRSLYDLVYNMNLAHLNPAVETAFETLDDAGLRTASTPFLIYRGRHRHDVSLQGLTARAVESGILKFQYGTWGPKELFYGDLYSSMPVPCRPSSVPGRRDSYSSCCAAELVSRDRFDFMLLSFPDNDNYSHRFGPAASVDSIEKADLCLGEVIRAGGGLDGFLRDHALIIVADHAHSDVDRPLDLIGGMAEEWEVLQASEDRPETAQLAVSPTSRAGHIYILERQEDPLRHRHVREHALGIEGVELVIWPEGSEGDPIVRKGPGFDDDRVTAVAIASTDTDGELRFAPADQVPSEWGDRVTDRRGREWSIRGDLGAIDAVVEADRIETDTYPDGLGRLYSAILGPHSGDLMISAAPGYECLDWGGSAHLGGGSHGSLRKEDSEGPLLFVGCGPDSPETREQWSLSDLVPEIRQFFGMPPEVPELPGV